MHIIAPAEPPLIRQTGLSYFPIAFVARLPFAMMVVGLLTLVVSSRESLALGGWASAAAGFGTAVCGPLLGAIADRRGQRTVLLVVGLANCVALTAMAWIVYSPAPDAAVIALAIVVGGTSPQVSPMSRSRLVAIIMRGFSPERFPRVLARTMAYESTADELVFVMGPVLVGVLATTMNPAAPVLGAAAVTAVFVTAFALHRTGAAAPGAAGGEAPQQDPVRTLLRPELLLTILATLGIGMFFGAMLTSLTAFMSEIGAPEQAGLIYGAMGVGSAIFALGAAWFSPRFTLAARWICFGGIALVGTTALPLVDSLGACALVLLVIGVGVGPTLVTLYHLGAERSPRGRISTVMTLLGTGIAVGQAIGSAVTGAIAESGGSEPAFSVTTFAAAVVLAAGFGNLALVRRRPAIAL